MNYTIISMTEHCKDDPMTLSIDKTGNKYDVWLSGGTDPRRYTHRTFDALTEAYKVFEKIASWMVFGYYSEADRRRYLETGTME